MRDTRSGHGQQRHLACLVVAQYDGDGARQLQLAALNGYLRIVLLGGILLLLATTILLLLGATATRGDVIGAVVIELVNLCDDRLARLLARYRPIVDLWVRVAEGCQGGRRFARVEAGGVFPLVEGLQRAVGCHIALGCCVQGAHTPRLRLVRVIVVDGLPQGV